MNFLIFIILYNIFNLLFVSSIVLNNSIKVIAIDSLISKNDKVASFNKSDIFFVEIFSSNWYKIISKRLKFLPRNFFILKDEIIEISTTYKYINNNNK
jgi:hypothetical protein